MEATHRHSEFQTQDHFLVENGRWKSGRGGSEGVGRKDMWTQQKGTLCLDFKSEVSWSERSPQNRANNHFPCAFPLKWTICMWAALSAPMNHPANSYTPSGHSRLQLMWIHKKKLGWKFTSDTLPVKSTGNTTLYYNILGIYSETLNIGLELQ